MEVSGASLLLLDGLARLYGLNSEGRTLSWSNPKPDQLSLQKPIRNGDWSLVLATSRKGVTRPSKQLVARCDDDDQADQAQPAEVTE